MQMEFGETNSFNLLTIVIPTYNRKERLISTLSTLFCQDLSCVKSVIVVDNCSNYDVIELGKTFNNGKLKILRNPFNIGMVSNVVNTFRYCETDWMWLLADDDIVDSNAINKIKDEITKYPDWAIIKFVDVFAKNGVVKNDFTLTDLEDFIDYYEKIGHLGEMIFMSNGAYNIRVLSKYMEGCFNYSYTQIPHLVLQMLALNEKKQVKYVNSKIVTYQDPIKGQQWAALNVHLGISTITHIPFHLAKRNIRRLYRLFTNNALSIVYTYLYSSFSDYNLNQVVLAYNNLWKYSMSPREKVLFKIMTNHTFSIAASRYQKHLGKIKDQGKALYKKY